MRNSELPSESALNETNIDQYCRSVESLLNGINSKNRNKTNKVLLNEEIPEHTYDNDYDLPSEITSLHE